MKMSENDLTLFKVLEKAIYFATKKHFGQVDKGGHPYILHPLRVMQSVDTLPSKIAAILHDVIEDTDATIDDLKNEVGVPEYILEAILAVTKTQNESKVDAAKRAAANPIARLVKLADVQDNMDLSRLPKVTQKDLDRLEKYKQVLLILNSHPSC